MITDPRTSRAVAAASGAADDLGVVVGDPRVLHDAFSVVVHLAPSPVVVRVPTVLPSSLTTGEQRAQQQRELAATGWLAAQGHPTVAPSPLVAAEPVERDGWSMTFWELVDPIVATEPTAAETGVRIARLHAALSPCPVDLAFMVPFDTVAAMLDELRDRPDLLDPADLDRARREWATLGPVLTSPSTLTRAFPAATVQPIHGDSPAFNVLHTPDGPVDSDFEHVTVGPVEWDLAFCPPETVDAYEESAAHNVDRNLITVMEAARMVQLVACFALVPQMPALSDGLRPALENWRTTPLAGGQTPA